MKTRIDTQSGPSTSLPSIELGAGRAGPSTSLRAGNTIIEALVAISLVIVGIVGIIQMVTRSFQANELAADRFVAAHLAAEGVEITRNYLEGYLTASTTSGGKTWEELPLPDVLPDGSYEVAPDLPNLHRSIPNLSTNPLWVDSVNLSYGYDNSSPAIQTKFFRTIIVRWSDPCGGTNAASASTSIRSIVTWTTRNTTGSLEVANQLESWRGDPVCRN